MAISRRREKCSSGVTGIGPSCLERGQQQSQCCCPLCGQNFPRFLCFVSGLAVRPYELAARCWFPALKYQPFTLSVFVHTSPPPAPAIALQGLSVRPLLGTSQVFSSCPALKVQEVNRLNKGSEQASVVTGFRTQTLGSLEIPLVPQSKCFYFNC